MKKLVILLAAALAIPAAAQGPTRSPTRSITYETGVCFGRCPVYSVTIHSNGRATFTGRRFTTVEGTREFRVPAGTYLRFARHLEPLRPMRAENIRYSGDRCRVMATDLPSATVTWHGQGGGRSLYFYYGCDMQRNRAMADRLRRAPELLPIGDYIRKPALTTSRPMTNSIGEMSDRARDVFRMVVEFYLESGQPVGSRTISRTSSLNLSPASIRNVMQDLEEAGLLAAPHTSAGRIPTETGLRLFVDAIMQVAEPRPEDRAAIEKMIDRGGPIEEAIASATAALSGLSACAGIVLVPKEEPALKQLAFVPLSPGQAVAVMVGSDGSVENRVIDLPPGATPATLAEVGNYVSARLSGLTLREAEARLAEEIGAGKAALDKVAQALVAQGLALWSEDGARRPVLIVRGQANLIDEHVAADLDRVRQLLDELEGKEEIARLLGRARDGEAMKIFIGSENELFALSGSSVIAAPYRGHDGKLVGVVGVIGPTRLNYARVVPMVDFTARTLSRLMG